jgi:CelD/BcsL family acetyltransferase involved in cellulose biosynthesis
VEGLVPVERYERIDSVTAEWDKLADRVEAPPWLRPGWISAWMEAFGKGSALEILVQRDAGRLVALVPLLSRRGALVSPANWHTPEFGLLADDTQAGRALATALFAGRPRSVKLGWVAAEGLEAVRAAAGEAHYRVLEHVLQLSPYIDFSRTFDVPRVKQARRQRRRLEEAGQLRFDAEADTIHLGEGFSIEGSGWKDERGTAIVSRPETRYFYERIADWAATRGTLRLFFLRFDERPIAFVLGIEDAGRLYYVKAGFDVDFRSFGPGVMIVHDMVAYAQSRQLRSFEFLGPDDPWKLEWTGNVRERRLFQAFSPKPAGVAESAVYAYGRPLAKRIYLLLRR